MPSYEWVAGSEAPNGFSAPGTAVRGRREKSSDSSYGGCDGGGDVLAVLAVETGVAVTAK